MFTVPVICPIRNSYTFSFLACLLLVLILMVLIIIAWCLWLLNFHCRQVSGTQNLCIYLYNCSKKGLYLLFILFSSFLSWSKASLCYCRPTALFISKEQGLCFIIFFISLPNTAMPERLWQKYMIFKHHDLKICTEVRAETWYAVLITNH